MNIFEKIRNEFPELQEKVHINSAAMSLMSRRSVEAVGEALKDRVTTTEIRSDIRRERAAKARKKIAELIHADKENVCIVTSTTEGLNIVAQGLDFKKGDSVVLAETEFIGNILPWLNLEKMGVRIKRAPAKYGRDPLESILETVDDRTKVVTASFVGWIDGFKNDINRIGCFCQERGIVFVVDAIQGIGAVNIDVRSAHVSFLSCGGQKWLMSPNGTGFIYVDKKMLKKLDSRYIGYLSVMNDPDRFDFRIDPKKGASRFNTGSINDSGIAAMEKSLDLILKTGVENIERHIVELNRYTAGKLMEKGYSVVTSLVPQDMSGILTFYGLNTPSIYKKLTERNIIVSLRNQWIRVSPHLYNNKDDMDRLLDAL